MTSPLTHNISGTAKAAAQTVLATHWFNEVMHNVTIYYILILNYCVADQVLLVVAEQHGGVGWELGLRQGETAGDEEQHTREGSEQGDG